VTRVSKALENQLLRKAGLPATAGRSRHGVNQVEVDGIKFSSKRESQRYLELSLLVRAGVIDNLELQYRIPIQIGGVPVMLYPSGRQLAYVADFRYRDIENGEMIIVEDVKMQSGYLTEVYKIKRALVLAMGIEIQEV